MGKFIAGFVVALALCAAAFGAWMALAPTHVEYVDTSEPASVPRPASPTVDETIEEPKSERPSTTRRRVGDAANRMGPGEIVLRPGEAFAFESRTVSRAVASPDADMLCLDIQEQGVSLRLPHGGTVPTTQRIVAGTPPPAATLFERLASAPAVLEPASIEIGTARDDARALLVVRAAGGRTFKVIVETVVHAPEVWLRSARLRYETIPSSEEPFVIPIPEALVAVPLSAAEQERLTRLQSVPVIPGLQFGDFAQGDHFAVESLDEDMTLADGTQDLFIRSPLAVELNLRARGSVVFGGGVAAEGKVKTGSYSALLVEGNVEGELETNSYAYVRVTGDVNGKINVRSYATVVVDGTVRGVIEVNSYGTLVLLGDVPDLKGAIRSRSRTTIYFGRHQFESAIRQIGPNPPVLIHLRLSDLPAGEHELQGEAVIVGDQLWNEVRW